jgi:hypothetical protein
MLILNKNQVNELILNINNNSRIDFSGYTLTFTHTLSQRVKSYNIDKSNPAIYGENDRYCEINLNMVGAANDLFYEGQYQLQIFGNGDALVYTALCRVDGGPEDNDFLSYTSPNENNDAYIYIE